MSDEFWKPFKGGGSYPFVKFENHGDGITGTIVARRVQERDETRRIPLLDIQKSDGSIMTADCGYAYLQRELADIEPREGDKIRITYTDDAKVAGRGTKMKVFEIQHRPAERPKDAVWGDVPPPSDDDAPF